MSRFSKNLASILILIVAISSLTILVVKPTNAQSIPKPSVPEFTVKYVDHSYDIPPTYGTDQYTGKTIVTKDGEHIDNRTIEITTINQPFTPFTDASSGRLINLYYNVRYKGSFGQDWTLLFGKRAEYSGITDPLFNDGYPSQDSSSQNTIISYTLPWNIVEGQIDVQTEALKGYVNRTIDSALSHLFYPVYDYTLYGEESGWSNTQAIAVPSSSNSPTNTNPLTAPAMTIITPIPVTYQNSSIPLFFGANVLTGSPEITSLSYSLDGNQNITITALGKTGIQHFDSQTGYTYHINSTLTLDNLANGNHTLWVYSHDVIGNEMSGSVQFTVDASSETPTEPILNYFWFLIPALIIVALVLLVVILLLFRRHRKTTNKA